MRRIGFAAGVVDYYCVGTAVNILSASYAAVTRSAADGLLSFLTSFACLLLIVAYHMRWWSRTGFMTPGERLMGRVRVDGEKRWTNPYGVNRIGLLIPLWLFFVVVVNTLEAAFDPVFAAALTIPSVLLRAVLVALAIAGAVAAGAGRAGAGFVSVAYLAYWGLANFMPHPAGPQYDSAARAVGMSGLGLALVLALSLLVYARLQARHVPSAMESLPEPST